MKLRVYKDLFPKEDLDAEQITEEEKNKRMKSTGP